MPVQINQIFGSLVAIKNIGRKLYGGRLVIWWLCKCYQCGGLEENPQTKLVEKHKQCCQSCSDKKTCIICNKEFISSSHNKNTCSEQCHRIKRNTISTRCYYTHHDQYLSNSKQRHKVRMYRMNGNKEFYQTLLLKWQKDRVRRRSRSNLNKLLTYQFILQEKLNG